MRSCKREAADLAVWIDSLEEPYRQNAIEWLRIYIRRPMDDLQGEIESFLKELDPVVRNYFLIHTRTLLKTAVHYFGTKDWGEFSPVGENPEATFEIPPVTV
jgi:hypothetical protein